jgi:hypothetical protein
VVEVLSLSVLEPPRRPSIRPPTRPASFVDDEVVPVSAAVSESVVVVAVTCATVDFLVVVEVAPVAAPVLGVPVMVWVFPFSSTERVIGTITTSGSESFDALDVVVAVAWGSGFKSDSSQLKSELPPFEEPNN